MSIINFPENESFGLVYFQDRLRYDSFMYITSASQIPKNALLDSEIGQTKEYSQSYHHNLTGQINLLRIINGKKI
ncbi:MAG: hypothetical protein CVU46_07585 [Chloroflexi bacterium HGW-Chloroflexi-8]|nr:MAG: hypothetical protein CVU46_07585 [Chloroflexi bacterium HGW-Chloroflexi-8]